MKALPNDVIADLVARYRAGDRRAGDRLLRQFDPLVRQRVGRRTRGRMNDADTEDLLQEGRLGLLRAIERFDPTNGAALITYATHWIDALVRNAARKLPIVALTTKERELVTSSPHRVARADEAARDAAIERLKSSPSLDAPTHGGEGRPFLDMIEDDGPSPEDDVGDREELDAQRRELRHALAGLRPRWLAIVTRRWLVPDPETLDDIGHGLGITRERVRQIEAKAFARIAESCGVAGRPRPTQHARRRTAA